MLFDLVPYMSGEDPIGLPSDPLELGRVYTDWFARGDLDRLWRRLGPGLCLSFVDPAGFRAFRERVRLESGEETAVLDERVTRWLGARVYSRTAAYGGAPGPVLMQWMLDAAGKVVGFLVEPAREPAPSRFEAYRTHAQLQLPVAGEWFVFWGGRHPVENYHAVVLGQRYACDLLIVRDSQTHLGDPPCTNQQFYCFGEPILAPAEGRVVAALDGIADNVPGSMNAENPLGNHVVLDHGNDEYSFLAHLGMGSVRVAVGDIVRAGQELGRCGNSGNSSEPHLHYHLQNTAQFGAGEGLPAQFVDFTADGVHVERGEPTRGQLVRGDAS
jgi:hypothetical protein